MMSDNSRKALSIFLVALMTLAMIPLLGAHVSAATDTCKFEGGGAEPTQDVEAFDEKLELTADTPTGSSYLLHDHHGGWWCDAEKTKDNDDDDLMCWAAAAANVLEWTGWGMTSGMWNTDEMFQYSLNYWDDRTGWPSSAWYWWFNNGTFADVPGGGNFWPGYTWTDYLHEESDPALALQAIDGYLQAGYGVAIGIWNGGHVITCWGFQYDGSVDKTTNPGDYYLGVWVTDSDDDKGWVGPAVDALNTLRYLPVNWNGTHWNLAQGYGGWHISGICGLEPFPNNNRPVANAGGPYSGQEGSPITFDGSGSSDPDGDSLMYRWDFDNDGLWDTGWSSSPHATHTYLDDYAGNAVLQVRDLHTAGALLDGAVTSVTVTNVAPTVDGGPDQTADEGYMISFSGSLTDPGTNDTHTIEWDFGDATIVTGTLALIHAYGDNGVYTVTLTVTDDDGGVGTDTLTATVANVAPTATVSISQPNSQFILPIVHTLAFDGSFTDLGWLDTHTATWDFGDGTIVPGTVTEENIEPDATGTTAADHIYSEPGTYTVTLTVTDDDGGVGTDTMQVIVVGAQEAVQITNEYIQALSDSAFKGNPNQRKKAFNNMFTAIDTMLDNEEYPGAIQHLRSNIREKADGTVDGSPKNDWIVDPTVQLEICMKIDDITAYLETLP